MPKDKLGSFRYLTAAGRQANRIRISGYHELKMSCMRPVLLAALRYTGYMIAGAKRAAGWQFAQVVDGEGKRRLEKADIVREGAGLNTEFPGSRVFWLQQLDWRLQPPSTFGLVAFALGSVFAWPLDMVHYEKLNKISTTLQPEPKLLLQGREYRRPARISCPRSGGITRNFGRNDLHGAPSKMNFENAHQPCFIYHWSIDNQ
jgi:hypothetical protein